MVSKGIKSVLWAATLCAVAPCGGGAATPQVDGPGLPSDADLLQVDAGDWLHFNRTYSGDRYSPLASINVSNAKALTPKCILQLGEIGSFETSPIVYHGRMYVTTSHKTFAADARTCAVIWVS